MAGRLRHRARVVARWVRDASALGLGEIDPALAQQALLDLARRHFGDEGEGIVRLEARAGAGGVVWLGTPREVGPEPATWSVGIAAEPHPGPRDEVGAKRADRAAFDRAKREATERGWDEALLVNADGVAVEGSRSNLVVALASGRLVTPPLARGAVQGVARAILRDHLPELEEADVAATDLPRAEELIAVNSVRGARSIVALDGRPVGDGAPGPWAAQLGLLLDANA